MATKTSFNVPVSPTWDGGKVDSRSIWRTVDSLSGNSLLKRNESIFSKNGAFELLFQEDGNLVLYRYRDRFPLWSTNTANSGAVQAVMQRDGNLVLYTAGAISNKYLTTQAVNNTPSVSVSSGIQPGVFKQSVSQSNGQKFQKDSTLVAKDTSGDYQLMAQQIWSSKTSGYPMSMLQLQNDGNLIIAHPSKTVWDSNTQRYLTAKQKILTTYEQVGHRYSPVGLPLTEVRSEGDNFVQHFRSGHITTGGLISDLTNVIQTNTVEVTWKGIECHQKQETFDEIIGTVATISPFSAAGTVHSFPEGQAEWTMGPGLRIINTNVKIYDGAVGDLYIVVSLMEHDSGNIDEYKKKIAALISKAATSFIMGDGASAETNASDMGLIGDLSLGAVNIMADFLGAGDDPFNPGSIVIGRDVMLNKFKPEQAAPDQFPTFLLDREGKTFTYTHQVTVEGRDDGGDLGQYSLYFTVELHAGYQIVNP